jgi:hypothetical protein
MGGECQPVLMDDGRVACERLESQGVDEFGERIGRITMCRWRYRGSRGVPRCQVPRGMPAERVLTQPNLDGNGAYRAAIREQLAHESGRRMRADGAASCH